MKLYVVVSGHMLGKTDAAYFHGVFSSNEKASEVVNALNFGEIIVTELDEVQNGDTDDYNRLPGIRVI